MRDMFKNGWGWIASVVMLMLLVRICRLKSLEIARALACDHEECQQRMSWHAEENRELKSALRASCGAAAA